jgi:hypothetical protein
VQSYSGEGSGPASNRAAEQPLSTTFLPGLCIEGCRICTLQQARAHSGAIARLPRTVTPLFTSRLNCLGRGQLRVHLGEGHCAQWFQGRRTAETKGYYVHGVHGLSGMMMRLPGSNPRGTMMMLPQLSTSEAADRLWVGYRTPIFASLHSVVASICLAATARGGAQALFILGPASLHALAVYCCVSKQLTPATGRKISAYSSVLSWVLRTGVSGNAYGREIEHNHELLTPWPLRGHPQHCAAPTEPIVVCPVQCYLRWHLGSPAEQAVGVAVFRMGSGQISGEHRHRPWVIKSSHHHQQSTSTLT